MLQGPPALPLQVVDFNFDRFNDIILVARDGIYGYVQVRGDSTEPDMGKFECKTLPSCSFNLDSGSAQVRSVGGVPFSALIACVIVACVVIYTTQQAPTGKRKKGRSTDRID